MSCFCFSFEATPGTYRLQRANDIEASKPSVELHVGNDLSFAGVHLCNASHGLKALGLYSSDIEYQSEMCTSHELRHSMLGLLSESALFSLLAH